jgi:beta-N-acetylhexosaminidase
MIAAHRQHHHAAHAAGVGGMMVGHIAMPQLDASGAPATLSQTVVTGLLREQLNFRGLVFTDDLEMGALEEYSAGDIAVRAIAAGCDMLLFCHNAQKAREAGEAIERAVQDKVLSAERVQDSIDRVRWAKRRFGVLDA